MRAKIGWKIMLYRLRFGLRISLNFDKTLRYDILHTGYVTVLHSVQPRARGSRGVCVSIPEYIGYEHWIQSNTMHNFRSIDEIIRDIYAYKMLREIYA